MPTYTSLGFRDLNNMLINKNSKYTQSDHIVIGLEFINSESSRFTVELFDKRYSNYPVSLTDMVSLANKGGDFEVLGNEKILTIGKGKSYGWNFYINKNLKIISMVFYLTHFLLFKIFWN